MSENDTPNDPYGFPEDLKRLQARLHRARAEHEALCRTLPWSAEPLPGWAAKTHPNDSKIIVSEGRAPSPGYTPQQHAEDTRLRDLVQELSAEVVTHPFWGTLAGSDRVAARVALKTHRDVLATSQPTVEAA
ncbi:hypothetical protein [Streptomyces zaomyceticus]|uniref:hypothetical protein n=1 Tax=Streptomyces zaomyceticus TaxID=68286 RepID=UPI0036CF70EA